MTQKKLTALTGSGKTHPEASKKDNSGNNFAARIPVTQYWRERNPVSSWAKTIFLAVGRDFTTGSKPALPVRFVEGVDYVIVEDLTSQNGGSKSRQRIEHDYIL
jgi:hypothetical protein